MPIDPLLLLAVPRFLEVAHVAHRLSVSQEWVRRLIREGKLPAVRFGRRWRVDPADLQAFIEAQRFKREIDPQAHRGRDGPRSLSQAMTS